MTTRRRDIEGQLPLWSEALPARLAPRRPDLYTCACGAYFRQTGADNHGRPSWLCEGCRNAVTCSAEHLSVYDCCWVALRQGVWPTSHMLRDALAVSRKQVHSHMTRLAEDGIIPPDFATYRFHEGLQVGFALGLRADHAAFAALHKIFGRTA